MASILVGVAACCAHHHATPSFAAQQSPQQAVTSQPDDLTIEAIEARRAALKDIVIDEAARQAADGLLAAAIESLKAVAEHQARAADIQLQLDATAELVTTLRADLAGEQADTASVDPPPEMTLPEIEQRRLEAEAAADRARQELAELRAEPDRRAARAVEIPSLIATLRTELADAEAALNATPPAGEAAAVTQARALRYRARALELRAQINALQLEARFIEARRDVLPLRIEKAERDAQRAAQLAAGWEAAALNRRSDEAARAAEASRRLAMERVGDTPQVAAIAAELEKDASEIAALTERIRSVAGSVASIRARNDELAERYRAAQSLVARTGLTNPVGVRLRRYLQDLPNVEELRRQSAQWRRDAQEADYRILDLKDDERDFDIDRRLRAVIAQASLPPEQHAELERVTRELLQSRRESLARLRRAYDDYWTRLNEGDQAVTRLVRSTDEFRSYIQERILWIRSVKGPWFPRAGDIAAAAGWLASPSQWTSNLSRFTEMLAYRWGVLTIGVVGVALLWFLARRARAGVRSIADSVAKYSSDSYAHTIRALALTAVAAAPVPVTVLLAAVLVFEPIGTVHATAVAAGMRRAALILFALGVLRQALRRRGLAEAHFRWPARSVEHLRRHVAWFMPVAAVMAFVVRVMGAQPDSAMNDALGRLAFLAAMGALAAFTAVVLHPSAPPLAEYLKRNPDGWFHRVRWVVYVLAAGMPAALGIAAMTGYYYTASELELRFVATLQLVSLLVLIFAMTLRWLFIERRRLAVERARKRAATRQDAPPAGEPRVEEPELDLPAISEQMRQLVRVSLVVAFLLGSFWIWADVLPALRMLERIQIWPSLQIIEIGADQPLAPSPSPATGAAATLPLPGSSAPEPSQAHSAASPRVSLADLGVAILIAIITYVTSRNLPGLLEIVVLQRLPLDVPSRFAITTVARYIIVIVGITATLGAVGIGWSTVQWLAAALTFGLAFGLQEIFANFVSGIIILIERPIRVGDTVTVGDVTGRVTTIRMRATTILDWDRKELVLPNKSFITDRVINWSLTGPVLRLIVPVGVAYGSDVEKVVETLRTVAANTENVLADPPPQALFLGFGDSALNFELRVFIPHIDHLVTTRHALHLKIDDAFRKAGIEIAFPQLDVHLRQSEVSVIMPASEPTRPNA